MTVTKIEWASNDDGTPGKSWNFARGCWPASPGCLNCYAAGIAARFSGLGLPFEGLARRAPGKSLPQWTGEGGFVEAKLADPFSWRKPTSVFTLSMSDLFWEAFSDDEIDQALAVMLLTPRHRYMTLTKRAQRMLAYLTNERRYRRVLAAADRLRAERPGLCSVGISNPSTHPAPWVWWGVSVENREHGLPRVDVLRNVPAAVRFLSIEPLLEDLGELDLGGIHWVIVGSESGPRARPMRVEWARSIVDQCIAAGVPIFVKQIANEHDRKGGNPEHWPPGVWPRLFPEPCP